MGIFSLLACAGPWTPDAALAPTLVRMDTDRDGRVVAEEYDAIAFSAPPFSEVDGDGDGAIDLDELRTLWRTQDPVDFHRTPQPPPAPGVVGPPGGNTFDVLQTVREEVLAADPGAAVPTEARLRELAPLALDAPETKALLLELQIASDAAGATFPPSLRQAGSRAPFPGPPGR